MQSRPRKVNDMKRMDLFIPEDDIISSYPNRPSNKKNLLQRIPKKSIVHLLVIPNMLNPIDKIHIRMYRDRAEIWNCIPDLIDEVTAPE